MGRGMPDPAGETGSEGVPIFQAVVTRFNMVLPSLHRSQYRIAESAMADWLAARTAIFETICLPSMLRQTRRPDAWLIGFDGLRKDAVTKMLDIMRPHPWIVPVWQTAPEGKHNGLEPTFVRGLLPMLKSEQTWTLTTRLDSDDALNLSHCQAVHRHARSVIDSRKVESEFWISFPRGVQLSKGDCRILRQENNAFLSRCVQVSRKDRPKEATVLARNHKQALRDSKCYLLSSERPMWLQYVHGTNLKNFVRTFVRPTKDAGAVLAEFGLGSEVLAYKPPAIDPAVLFSGPRPTSVSGNGTGLRGLLRNLRNRLSGRL